MSVKVEFIPNSPSEEINGFLINNKQYQPVPSYKALPEGYKVCPSHFRDEPNAVSIKRCIPVLDAYSAGFLIKAHIDFKLVINSDNSATISCSAQGEESPVSTHLKEQAPYVFTDLNIGFKEIFKWDNPWSIKTPKGYSCLFVNPLNSGNKALNFFSGIVDTDTYYARPTNFPFFINKGYTEFFIKAGDPLIQVIPFKRENTKHVVREWTPKEQRQRLGSAFFNMHKLSDVYRSFYWHKRKEK